jgi:hypothetical protein
MGQRSGCWQRERTADLRTASCQPDEPRLASDTAPSRSCGTSWKGDGEIWRHRAGESARVDVVRAGDSVRIPVDTAFQFQTASTGDLTLLLATMPPWPGGQEAVAVSDGVSPLSKGVNAI